MPAACPDILPIWESERPTAKIKSDGRKPARDLPPPDEPNTLCQEQFGTTEYSTQPNGKGISMNQFERDQLRQTIKTYLKCDDYLPKSKGSLKECPLCGSGTGANGTGAVKVYPENTWYCFACKNEKLGGKAGDVIDLIRITHECDYNEALRIGADMAGIPYPERQQAAVQKKGRQPVARAKVQQEQSQQAADLTEYYSRCEQMLEKSSDALSYLADRGISQPVWKAHKIGFDPQADPAGKGHTAPRIIIPVSPYHYIGRRIDGGKDYAKLNNAGVSPDILDRSLIWTSRIVFVVEGAFDCMSIIEAGQPAIATNSTSNIDKLLGLLEKKPCKAAFIICMDNDPDPQTAGKTKAAAERLHKGLSELGYKSMIADICGQYKDPNEALVKDRDGFKQMISAARDRMEEYMNRDYLTDFLDKIQTEAYKPYRTDLTFFDELLNGGVVPQSLLLLMAAPAAGKTTLCQMLAERMAAHRKPIEYLNLEMSREQMLAKAIAGRINSNPDLPYHLTAMDIMQGYKWTDELKQAIPAEIETYRQQIFPYLQYNPDTGNDIDSIREHLTRIGDRTKSLGEQAPAVILDYLHLVRAGKEKLETADLIKKIVVTLKEYAIKYDTFVIGIVAINRQSKDNITLESGRDSSNIEYTADYILSLDYKDKESDVEKMSEILNRPKRTMVLRVLKNRFGAAGRFVNLTFQPAEGIFSEWLDAESMNENPFESEAVAKAIANRK